eukprot:TRINITY_DN1236_c0_g1_i1.p2 TRINITY_DN1236_c0_g1~~TRINITY_DN1236_c0_g1_i1.p2  ORF type:complete len:112 (-),score=26.73 TRINITY_DN1236_c0_g1_i1:18-353(-)
MSAPKAKGAAMQNYNNELIKCIEDLREKRDAVSRQVSKDEDERAKIQTDIRILTERLQRLEGSLGRKAEAVREYDRTITETEAAYAKILESSQTLLSVLKRETVAMGKGRE